MPRITSVKPARVTRPVAPAALAERASKPVTRSDGFVTRGGLTSTPSARAATAKTSYRLDVNTAYFPDVMKLIGGAKRSVDIVQYNFFSESGDGKLLADALIAKKQQALCVFAVEPVIGGYEVTVDGLAGLRIQAALRLVERCRAREVKQRLGLPLRFLLLKALDLSHVIVG